MLTNMIQDPVEWRRINLNASENRKNNFARLPRTSDLRRMNTFIRRLKDYKPESQYAIISDMSELNLKRYISECIAALVVTILEGKAKVADMEFIGKVCSEMHQCYEGVELAILKCIKKKWNLEDSLGGTEESRETQRDRSMIRFICELYRTGVTSEWRIFRWILQKMYSSVPHTQRLGEATDSEVDESFGKLVVALGHLNVLVRSIGACLFGAGKWPQSSQSTNIKDITESFQYEFHSPPAAEEEISTMIVQFINAGLLLLDHRNNLLRQIWRKNLKTVKHVGDVPDSLRMEFDRTKSSCENLYDLLFPLVATFPPSKKNLSCVNLQINSVPSLEELFAETKKALGDGEKTTSMIFLSGLSSFYSVDSSSNDGNFYENDEEQQFYENCTRIESKKEKFLKDFEEKGRFPCTEQKAVKNIEHHIQNLQFLFANMENSKDKNSLFEEINSKSLRWVETFLSDQYSFFKFRSLGDRDHGKSFLLASKRKFIRSINIINFSEKTVAMGVCCILNILDQSGDIDLIDISERSVKEIEESFFQDIGSKSIENSAKQVIISRSRFLIEGMKFRFVSPGTVLKVLDSFAAKDVLREQKQIGEILFQCLQDCGGFLAKNPLAIHKFKSVLQTTLKSIRALGGELELQLGSLVSDLLGRLTSEHEYRAPTAIKGLFKQKSQTSYERYLRHLIYSELNESSVENIAGKILDMQLSSQEIRMITFNILRKSHRLRFQDVPSLAKLLKFLALAGIDFFAQYIVDDVIERCRQDLECSQPLRSRQKQSRDMSFFLEMFKSGLVHETDLFFVLYMICSYSIANEVSYDFTRIRLIAILLDGFDGMVSETEERSAQKFYRLRVFLLHFYVLIHSKDQPFPIELNFVVCETIEKMKKYFSSNSKNLESFPNSLQMARKLANNAYRRNVSNDSGKTSGKYISLREETDDPVSKFPFLFESANVTQTFYPIYDNADDRLDKSPAEHRSSVSSSDMNISEDKVSVIYSPEEKSFDGNEFPEQMLKVEQNDVLDQYSSLNSPPGSVDNNQATDFDRLLREMTKESFTSIRQQNSIRAMSGRRATGSQSIHVANLRRITQSKMPTKSIGALDLDNQTMSVAIAVRARNKSLIESQASLQSERKPKAYSNIDFRVVHIPQGTKMAMQQTANIEEKKRERAEIKRATQSIVNCME